MFNNFMVTPDDQLSLCSDTDRNYQQLYPLLPSSSHPITSDPSLSPSSILPVSTDVNYDECLPYCSSYQPVISKGMNSLSDVYSEDWSVDGILLSSINERRGHLGKAMMYNNYYPLHLCVSVTIRVS